MKQFLQNTYRRFRYDLVRYINRHPELDSVPDLSEAERKTILNARPYTMTSIERMAALINAVTYVSRNQIPGDIAECGVWRGGSMMTVALTLLSLGDTSRNLYLYDTYEGMSDPTSNDKSLDGAEAKELLTRSQKGTGIWCYASLDDVRNNIHSTGYPKEKIHLIKGKVEETIPNTLPKNLALLRLDTDWYESTLHELKHLYPLLNSKGVLVIDDYGHWQGARKAVDEYFQAKGQSIYLHRIDYTGRILVKTGS